MHLLFTALLLIDTSLILLLPLFTAHPIGCSFCSLISSLFSLLFLSCLFIFRSLPRRETSLIEFWVRTREESCEIGTKCVEVADVPSQSVSDGRGEKRERREKMAGVINLAACKSFAAAAAVAVNLLLLFSPDI